MSDYRFILPTYLTFKFKTKKDRKVAVNLNWFRHAHHRDYTKAKELYCEIMKGQLCKFDPIPSDKKLSIRYDFYAARNDSPDLDNFAGAAKKFFQDAMVKNGFIEDDNVNFIVSNSEHYSGIDRQNPRIEVFITCLDDK